VTKTTSPWVTYSDSSRHGHRPCDSRQLLYTGFSLCNFCAKNSPPWLEVSEWRRSVPSHAAGFSCVVRVRKSCHWSPSSASATTSPSLSSVDKPRPAKGALVLEPETGVYMEDPIVVLTSHLCTRLPSSRRTCPMTPCSPCCEEGRCMVEALGLKPTT
jgi:hypothetical protein